MSKAVIRLGDPTDHGGVVVSVSATQHTVDGIPVLPNHYSTYLPIISSYVPFSMIVASAVLILS